MTVSEMVAKHPCPIIREKILGYVRPDVVAYNLTSLLRGRFSWLLTNEGKRFWSVLASNPGFTYEQLKYFDATYVAKPAVAWRKIDKDNFSFGRFALRCNNDRTVYYEDVKEHNIGVVVRNYTHYIPLSELINLPIEY